MTTKVPYILGQLNDSDAEWLGSVGRKIRCKPGEMLIQSGTRLEQIFIVLDGVFVVDSPTGTELARVGLGDILGEMSMVDRSLTSATVVATTNALVLAIDTRLIEDRLALDPSFAARFYQALAKILTARLRDTLARFGHGTWREYLPRSADAEPAANPDAELAGARFERMLRKLWGQRE